MESLLLAVVETIVVPPPNWRKKPSGDTDAGPVESRSTTAPFTEIRAVSAWNAVLEAPVKSMRTLDGGVKYGELAGCSIANSGTDVVAAPIVIFVPATTAGELSVSLPEVTRKPM